MTRRSSGHGSILLWGLCPIAVAACGNGGTPGDAATRDTAPVSDMGAPPGRDATPGDDATARDAAPTDDAADAAPTDAAPADASPPDAGRSFSTNRMDFGLGGASRCATAHVQLCEDFESGTLDAATWSVTGTRPTIDMVHAARGSRAMHVLMHGQGASYIAETRTFPAPRNTYYGRIFLYFQSLPLPAMGYAHWTFAAGTGTVIPGEIRLSGQLQSGRNLFGVGTDSRGFTGDWTTSDNDPTGSPRPVPTGEWMCIEWMHAGEINETAFYWDGAEHPSLHTTATHHGFGSGGDASAEYILPQFNRAWVGWQEYQTSTETFELWIDEVAIDSARIGCVL